MSDRILVTGGLGFIGSAFIRMLGEGNHVLNVDLDTYAGDVRRLQGIKDCRTEHLDVADPSFVNIVIETRPDVMVHFAAESHVTRSEGASDLFFHSNVDGTRRVLEAAEQADVRVVVHVSTDEVYGPCTGPPFKEDDKQPGEGLATSAYARSKAIADDLARSFFDRVPLIVVRPTNCFGPWQHPEKAVARWATRALRGERIPVWGDGGQVRDWLFVTDACEGIKFVIDNGEPGQVYNLAPEGSPRTNLEVARAVAAAAGRAEDAVYLTSYDRPDHDRRYAIDAAKIRELGWNPTLAAEERIAETVEWYRDNREWWEALVDEAESLYNDSGERSTVT